MIYVNGDSYVCVSDGKRYSEFLGDHYNCEVINAGISGSSNSRIFRTSLRDLIDLQKKYSNIKAVISLSFPMRTEVWDSTITHNRFVNDGEFTSFHLAIDKRWFYDNLPINQSKYQNFYKQFITYYDIEAETIKILQNIILLTNWCKNNNIQYVILSGPLQEPIDFNAPCVKNFYDEVNNDKNVINLFNDSFTEWCVRQGYTPMDEYTQEIQGRTYNIGHHGKLAHEAFAKFLIENYFK